jgi:hypothetical protein
MKIRILKTAMIAAFSFFSLGLFADPPGMPGDHGQTGDQPPGGGAPIGAGIGFLLAMGSAYGVYKMKLDKN